jgi:hypothetical protein
MLVSKALLIPLVALEVRVSIPIDCIIFYIIEPILVNEGSPHGGLSLSL